MQQQLDAICVPVEAEAVMIDLVSRRRNRGGNNGCPLVLALAMTMKRYATINTQSTVIPIPLDVVRM